MAKVRVFGGEDTLPLNRAVMTSAQSRDVAGDNLVDVVYRWRWENIPVEARNAIAILNEFEQ